MNIEKLIATAKKSYETNKYQSYKECYNGGVLALAELVRREVLQHNAIKDVTADSDTNSIE